jgi:hypothetical protein
MNCYKCLVQQGFPAMRRQSIALGRVWWRAQNWAQSRKCPPGHCKAPAGLRHKSRRNKPRGRLTWRPSRPAIQPGPVLSCPAARAQVAGDAFPPVRALSNSYYFFVWRSARCLEPIGPTSSKPVSGSSRLRQWELGVSRGRSLASARARPDRATPNTRPAHPITQVTVAISS